MNEIVQSDSFQTLDSGVTVFWRQFLANQFDMSVLRGSFGHYNLGIADLWRIFQTRLLNHHSTVKKMDGSAVWSLNEYRPQAH